MPQNSGEKPPREIVEQQSYAVQLRALRISYRDLDCALDRMVVALGRRPEIFPEVLDTGVHRLRVNGYARFPDLDIWFTFDHQHVWLHYAEIAPDEE